MNALSRLFFFAQFGFFLSAHARLPETKAEQSLLYWRYLCREQLQEERVKNQIRELNCKSQGWTVRSPASTGRVIEVRE